ncbi:hypothetical protein NKI59_19460 [Mesorhizobium sp. M0598]|uniref:hypothetical protein n=1 Tax=Mesorhizobium sp. M0598 TaxID=2956968 RepID=UPI00333DA529
MDQYSESDVREALTPYHARIRAVIERGFAEWLSVSECRASKGFSPVLYPRTISNYVFDAIARYARTEFASDKSVRTLDESQTVKFCFDGKVIARFKKGDDDNLGQNILTLAVLDFIDPQMNLPGFPPEAAKVEFVWSANDIGTAVQSMLVVARNNDRVLWSYEIDDAGESSESSVIILPSSPPDDDGPLVTPKIKTDDETAKGE